jgi:CRP-like cAMP-binding protein
MRGHEGELLPNSISRSSERPEIFRGVLPADRDMIFRAGRRKQFKRGEILHFEGQAPERVYLLTSGLVKVTKLGPGGKEVILRLSTPGDVFGATQCPFGQHCSTAHAFRPSATIMWGAEQFDRFVERVSRLRQNMLTVLTEDLRELEDRFSEVATQRIGVRVAVQLLRLVHSIGRPVDKTIEIELSREELGQMTGTTLFTISRVLSAWESYGVVKPLRGTVAICDLNSLRLIAQGGDTDGNGVPSLDRILTATRLTNRAA